MGGTLGDYVPFYFTSHSPMAFNIKTGFRVPAVVNEDIVIFCASLRVLHAAGIAFLFTDGHALATQTTFQNDLAQLDRIDWKILQARDFVRDNEDLNKVSRYEAEALIRDCLPCQHLKGIACHNDAVATVVKQQAKDAGVTVSISAWPQGYFQ
jgi:hypothetical protein